MWFRQCLVVLCMAICAESATMFIPKEFKRLMSSVQNLESFLKAFGFGNVTLFGGPSVQEMHNSMLTKPGISSVLPPSKFKPELTGPSGPVKRKKMTHIIGRTRVVSFTGVSDLPMILENVQCSPHPTVVDVPQPDNNLGIHYPYNVMLHRCAGSCNTSPKIKTCEAIETKEIKLLVFNIGWSSASDKRDNLQRMPQLIKVLNHTKCGCKCISKPSDCNATTQRFSHENCRCECKLRVTKKCPMYHDWDPVGCKCVCNPPQNNIYCPRRFEWSKAKCACVCTQKKCRANKIRNHRNCRCYCPRLPPCKHGMKRSKRDCKCE